MAMMLIVYRNAPSASTGTDQLTIYAVGIAVSSCTLFYYWLLEDSSPYLCLDPLQHFAMGLTLEQYYEKFFLASTSATFAADVERILGIHTRQELDAVISLMTFRFEIRLQNMRRMCLAAYPMMAMNLIIFITNMTRFCYQSGNNFIVDCSSVLCIILIGASRRDLWSMSSDTFMSKFLLLADTYRKNFKRKVTLKAMVRKLVVLKRFGFQLPVLHNRLTSNRYSYSTAHYVAKQFVEDIVEDSTSLRCWYQHLVVLDDDEHNFSDRAAEDRSASSDLRLVACLACSWVADEISIRACPEDVSSGDRSLSNIVLFLASLTVQRISTLAMQEPASVNITSSPQNTGLSEEIVKLAILLALQAEFDAAEKNETNAVATSLFERLSGLLDKWSCSTEPRSTFYKSHAVNEGFDADVVSQRSFQILYLSDVDFRDNTLFFDAVAIKTKVVQLIASKLNISEADYDRIQNDLYVKDPHLFTASGLEKQTIVEEESAAEALSMEIEAPSCTVATTITLDDEECGRVSKECGNDGKCAPCKEDQNCAPTDNQGCAPPDNQGCAPSVKTKYDRQSPFEFLSEALLDSPTQIDAAQIELELQALQDDKAVLSSPEFKTGGAGHVILAYLRFWARNSVLIKFLLWVNWTGTAWALVRSLLYRVCTIILFVPLCVAHVVCLAIDGKLFTTRYWLGLVPRAIRTWSRTQTNSFIVDKFATSLILGILSNRFMRCAVHIGEPVRSYNRGGVVAVILVIFFFFVYLHFVFVGGRKEQVFHLLLPACAMILGGFLALKTAGDTLADELYLGLGPAYDLADQYQTILVPVLYGLMHCALVLFCFLPLTMCRLTLLRICELPYIGSFAARLLGTHNMYGLHRELGYLMLILILVGAVIWWIAIYHACSNGSVKGCRAFYPEGNYFDIRGPPWYCETVPTKHQFYRVWLQYSSCVVQSGGNPGAVLFLREIITFLLTMICITAEFKYPLLASQMGASADTSKAAAVKPENSRRWLWWADTALEKVFSCFSKIYKDYLGSNEFEIFIWTHIFITYAIAIAAFFSRFEVFHAAAVCWGLFFCEKIVIMILHTHTFKVSRETELFEGAIKLVLKKRHWLPWKSKAGEIAFLQCPRIGPFWLGRQWHAFSLASSNTLSADDAQDQIEFLIQVHGRDSWTHSLSRALFDPKSKLSYHSPIYLHVRGPFGSSFQGYREADVIMLVGGGSGIASSLSVLRELVTLRGNVKKVWFIFAARQFSRLVSKLTEHPLSLLLALTLQTPSQL